MCLRIRQHLAAEVILMGMGRKRSVLKMKRRKGQIKKKARILRRKASEK